MFSRSFDTLETLLGRKSRNGQRSSGDYLITFVRSERWVWINWHSGTENENYSQIMVMNTDYFHSSNMSSKEVKLKRIWRYIVFHRRFWIYRIHAVWRMLCSDIKPEKNSPTEILRLMRRTFVWWFKNRSEQVCLISKIKKFLGSITRFLHKVHTYNFT